MGIIRSTVKVGQKPPKEVIMRVKKAVKEAHEAPFVYDPDCPPSSPEALKEFAQLAAERNRRNKKRSITIRVNQEVLETYKSMGNGYTGIMSDVLQYAINNPSVLTEATK